MTKLSPGQRRRRRSWIVGGTAFGLVYVTWLLLDWVMPVGGCSLHAVVFGSVNCQQVTTGSLLHGVAAGLFAVLVAYYVDRYLRARESRDTWGE